MVKRLIGIDVDDAVAGHEPFGIGIEPSQPALQLELLVELGFASAASPSLGGDIGVDVENQREIGAARPTVDGADPGDRILADPTGAPGSAVALW